MNTTTAIQELSEEIFSVVKEKVDAKVDKADIGIIDLTSTDLDPDTLEFTLSATQLLEVAKKYCIVTFTGDEERITLYKTDGSIGRTPDFVYFITIPTSSVDDGVITQSSYICKINTTTGEGVFEIMPSIFYNTTKTNALLSDKQLGVKKTGAELEELSYTPGELYYCTSSSDSFAVGNMYLGVDSSTVVKLSNTSVSTKPAINSFTISPTSTEYGNGRTITYSYSLKKYSAFTTLTINTGGTTVETITPSASGSGTLSGTYYNNTFTLTGTATGVSGTLTNSKTITPTYRQFYYASASTDITTILSSLKNVTSSTSDTTTYLQNYLPGNITVQNAGTSSSTKYVYFIVPSSLTITKVMSSGFEVPQSLIGTYTFTNSYNASYSVKVYRTDNKTYGEFNADLS